MNNLPSCLTTIEQKTIFGLLCAKHICNNDFFSVWVDNWISGKGRDDEKLGVLPDGGILTLSLPAREVWPAAIDLTATWLAWHLWTTMVPVKADWVKAAENTIDWRIGNIMETIMRSPVFPESSPRNAINFETIAKETMEVIG